MFYVRYRTGVAYNIIFVFNVGHNAATASYRTMQPGSFCRLASTFQTVSWETKGPRLVCRNPKPNIYQSWLGVSFLKPRRWSAAKLGVNICFFLLSRCRCLLSCFRGSITCFFLHSHWWRYEEPEGINSSLSFLF